MLLLLLLTATSSAIAAEWTVYSGSLPQGGDVRPPGNYTTKEAELLCSNLKWCAGFTFSALYNISVTPVPTYFKGAATGTKQGGNPPWWTYAKKGGAPQPPFSYHGCDAGSDGEVQKWCDRSASHSERVALLLKAMTLEEKIGLLSPNANISHNTCNCHTAGVARLGLPVYMWLAETNTDVSSACLGPDHCATTFSGPLGLGASFNRTLWRQKGSVIGTETRAMNNIGWFRDAGGTVSERIGVTGFGPNINQPRDPRNGRYSELPSEDPVHAGLYGAEMLKGMQEEDKNGYPKMLAFVKHLTAYSQETGRGYDTFNISKFNMFDTYLPQYELAFKQGKASGAMCSYNGENGHPSCANSWLLNDVVRGMWNQTDALITTDCGAVANLRHYPANAPNNMVAASWAINNGTDLEMGGSLLLTTLLNATKQGLVTEATITAAARRTLLPLFRGGLYDAVSEIGWSSLDAADIGSKANLKVRDDAALQSFVLLKNKGRALPLKKGTSIAVLGPQSSGYGLFSDYFGDDVCFSFNAHYQSDITCITTIADAVRKANVGGHTVNATGVDIDSKDASRIPAALTAAKAADVIILALGLDKSIEHEGSDRPNTLLPGLQEEFAAKVYALGKPVVLVLTNGGPLSIDNLVDGAAAIVEAFNPAFGAPMLAKTLFGDANKWGKMPYTVYNANYTSQVKLDNYDMALAPGRSYRYYTGEPLFKYGQGLSYTDFTMSCSCGQTDENDIASAGMTHGGESDVNGTRCGSAFPVKVTCSVANTGTVSGDEVVQLYHAAGKQIRAAASHPVPIKALVDFQRISLEPKEETKVVFALEESAFRLVNADGARVIYKGARSLIVSRGVGVDVVLSVTI